LSENENVITIHSIDLGSTGNAVFSMEDVKNFPDKLFSVGIHPWSADMSKIEELRACASLKNVVAIGESGLDKMKIQSSNDFDIQKELFKIHAGIAEEYGKPLIVHCVKAWNELIEIRKAMKPAAQWIIHGFRGKEVLASQLINEGMYLSFGKYHNAESLKKAWKCKRLFAETDDKNVDIQEVYNDISNILGITNKELSDEIQELLG
jgi:TatD DNase family protein